MLNRLYQLKKSEEGFTLIELMIVMVVLGILAGIVLFAVGNFQTDATSAKDRANTRICETAKTASAAKNNGSTAQWASYVASGTTC